MFCEEHYQYNRGFFARRNFFSERRERTIDK
jgi:hypothetical protein